MKWFDESKGVLDYILAAVPLLTLTFMVIAYFHTIHPRFAQNEELKNTKEKLATLDDKLKALTANNYSLNEGIEHQIAKVLFLEKKLIEFNGQEAYQKMNDTITPRYYRKQDVISAYIKSEGDTYEKISEMFGDPKSTEIDINQDGEKDLFVTHGGYCGSGGCTGKLFVADKGSYCFSVLAHTKTLQSQSKPIELQCKNIMTKDSIWLYDLLNDKTVKG